jgi:dTDP-4-amino-4,6-dideoxygalactose transaminase
MGEPLLEVPMVDLVAQTAEAAGEVRSAIERVLASGMFVLGPEVEALEREMAARHGVAHAVGVSSGTDALLLALQAAGVERDDEVITSPFSFVATAEAIVRLGARPVFVDLAPGSFHVGAAQVAPAITGRTKAVLAVSLFGQTCDLCGLQELTNGARLALVHDAAQAVGANHHGRSFAAYAATSCLSFFPTKTLGALGDGGMVLVHDDQVARRLRSLRVHGMERRYHATEVGGNYRLDALQAAVLRAKLPHLDGWITARRRNAAVYSEVLATTPAPHALVGPATHPGNDHAYHQFVVRVADGARDRVRAHLAARGVATEVYYPSLLPDQPAFAAQSACHGELAEARRACREVLAIPVHSGLDAVQRGRVADALRSATQLSQGAAPPAIRTP